MTAPCIDLQIFETCLFLFIFIYLISEMAAYFFFNLAYSELRGQKSRDFIIKRDRFLKNTEQRSII